MIALHALVVVLWALVAVADRARIDAPAAVRLSRGWLVAGIALWLAAICWPDGWTPVPAASWAASGARALASSPAGKLAGTLGSATPGLPWGWLVWVGPALGIARLLVGMWQLRGELGRSPVLRQLGRVEVRAADRAAALALPSRAVILVDPAASPGDVAVAVRHEGIHHRRGDTAFAWAWAALEAVAFPNPLARSLVRRVRTLEEIACDAVVIRSVEPRLYAESLLRAAARCPPRSAFLPVAAFPHEIHRRLSVLTRPPVRSIPVLPSFFLGVGLLTAVAGASAGAPDDPTAGALAKIEGSPKARAFYRDGLTHRAQWSELVDGALADAGLPSWYAAIPLVESGYTNLGAPGDPKWTGDVLSRAPGMPGRGLWMFIPQTARTYGLAVDGATDERFDPARETAAAVALLTDLHDEFGDWYLALAAYNQGPERVRAAIDAAGTRDVWALVEAGELNGYVPEVAAAAEILEHPELVR